MNTLLKHCLFVVVTAFLICSTPIGLLAEDKPDIPEELKKKLRKKGYKLEEDLKDDDEGRYKNAIPMRWRIYSSQESGVAFRFPYFYSTPDQYQARIVRRSSWFMRDEDFEADIELKSKKVLELGGGDIDEMANKLLGQDMSYVDYDYYQSPERRLFADKKWAPEGVKARLGKSESHVSLVVMHGDRISALLLTGDLAKKNNQAVIDSFEVMNRPKKYRKRKKGPLMTFRESTFMDKKVLDANGVPMKLTDSGPAPWDQTWEVETAHYHVTCQVSPAKAWYYGMLCEALYREFYDLYQPESVIPFKMEIHIFNTFKDFQSSAGSIGIPIGFGTGGFFAPSLLCIFAYEKSTDVSPDFTPDKVIAHELSHQFLHLTCNGSDHVPTWLNEGLAVYFETFSFDKGRYINRPPRGRINQLVRVYNQTKDVLWSMDNYVKHYGHIPALNYAEVYAMTHFWVFGAGKAGKKRFVEYWKALKNGEDGTEAFEEIFLKDIIKAKGSRGAAIMAWEIELKNYVMNTLSKLK